jgi:hypothetical protein
MTYLSRNWLLLTAVLAPLTASANDIQAGAVTDVSVTVYRAPYGVGEALDLDSLDGFALVSETRTVSIPAGESRIRFEGVADGIDAASALITGLPDGVLEKNRDAHLLSPSSLVAATVGRAVRLVRKDPATGKTTATTGTLLSDDSGITFLGPEGLEALRCSGLSETFEFDASAGATLTATPTLSALVRSPRPITAQVKLSYLARGFDWMANYVATVAPDGKTLDLGAWVTLGNSNAVTFAAARAQVVAGRLNRESSEVEPIDPGQQILAQCWPRGSTSDTPERPNIVRADPLWLTAGGLRRFELNAPEPAASAMFQEVAVTGSRVVKEEQLGDLKLYRVPDRTSVTSRQLKQVRLLDRQSVPFEIIYHADLSANITVDSGGAEKLLRTRNDAAHHLNLPLPSGHLSTFLLHDGVPLLVNESAVRDTALNQEFEIDAGDSADVQVSAAVEDVEANLATLKKVPLIPHVVHLRETEVHDLNRIEVSNARSSPISMEISVRLDDGETLVRSDVVPISRNGMPTLRFTVPANQTVAIRYQTGQTSVRPEPDG